MKKLACDLCGVVIPESETNKRAWGLESKHWIKLSREANGLLSKSSVLKELCGKCRLRVDELLKKKGKA